MRELKCDSLFIDLNKKKDFTESDLKKIRKAFIKNCSLALLTRAIELNISGVLFFALIILLAGVRSVYDLLSLVIVYLIALGLIKLLYNYYFIRLNDFIKVSRLKRIISMSYNKKCIGMSDSELSSEVRSSYNDAMNSLIDELPSRKELFTSTHEIMRLGLIRLRRHRNDFKLYGAEDEDCLGYKIIKEKFMNYSFEQCVKLFFNTYNPSSEEFKTVLNILKAEKAYKITIKRI